MKIRNSGRCFLSCLVTLLSFLFISIVTHASPNLVTFQSRIVQPNGQALEAGAVSFRFSITDALGTCVIYQEDFPNRNMSGSKGLINLPLGGGTKVYPAGAMALNEVFNNYNFPTFNCQAGGTINAGATDRRRLVMQFNDGSGWQTVPAMDINANPFAMQATTAYNLGDYPAADYLRTATMPTCGPTEALNFNGTSITCVAAGGAGAGTVTNVTSANADIGIATGNSTPVLTLNAATTGADKILRLNATGGFDAINASNLTNINATNLASGTVPAARFPAFTGDVTTVAGNVATTIAANAVTSAKILDDEIVDADIKSNAAIARSKIAAESAGNGPGNVLINDGSGNISSLQCADTQVIKFNGAGVAVCGTDNAGTGDIINGGNLTGSSVTIGTNDAQSLVLETNNVPALTILNSGNVGVGTASPSQKLHVVGTGKFRAGSANIDPFGTPTVGVVATSSSFAMPLFNLGTNSIGLYAYGENFGIFSEYGVNYFGGNVGVGTISPSSLLDVSSAAGAVQTLSRNSVTVASGDSIGKIQFWNNDTQLTTQKIYGNIEVQAAQAIASDAAAGNMIFRTTGTTAAGSPVERMRIDSSGNVGVGTTSPNNKLTVSGNQDITGNLAIGTTTMTSDINLRKNKGAGAYVQSLAQNTNSAGGTAWGVQNNGTTGGWIEVLGSTYSGGYPFETANTFAVFSQNTNFSLATHGGAYPMQFWTNGTERMRIDGTSGNVGIGTAPTDAETKLDVNGTVSSSASIEGISSYANSTATYTIPDTSVNIRRITATENTTITLPTFTSTATRVYTVTVFVKQDGAGSRTVAWAGAGGDTIKWDSGVAPTISANPNKITILKFTKPSDETVWYGSMVWRED